jgi:hypothetical protein
MGLSFCQVMRSKQLGRLRLGLIETNQWWKGTDASLIARTKTPTLLKIVNIFSFEKSIALTRRAEEIDWIEKYFIISSFWLIFFSCLRIVQKVRVLISSRIQIISQEFENKIRIEEDIINVLIIKLLLMICGKNEVNSKIPFSCFEDR